MKVCSKCKLEKSEEDFNWRFKSKNRRQSICRDCQRQINIDHYKNNSKDYKDRAIAYKANLKEKFYDWILGKSCVDCGETDPVVLDCDHVKAEKICGIAEMLNDSRSWALILEELAKCEIRCANCHRRKTAKQFGWYKIR